MGMQLFLRHKVWIEIVMQLLRCQNQVEVLLFVLDNRLQCFHVILILGFYFINNRQPLYFKLSCLVAWLFDGLHFIFYHLYSSL